MTFSDMQAIETAVAGLVPEGEQRPPVMLPADYDRVDIDVSKWSANGRELLCRSLGDALSTMGRLWDVWFADGSRNTLCVSEREEAE